MSPSSSPDNTAKCGSSSSNKDWLSLSDDDLMAECRFERFRVSGPGGQHRNKTDSAVRLDASEPSGVQVGYASERRSQHQNRTEALKRAAPASHRGAVASRALELGHRYHPPRELQRILPRGQSSTEVIEVSDRIGPRHRDFWTGARSAARPAGGG